MRAMKRHVFVSADYEVRAGLVSSFVADPELESCEFHTDIITNDFQGHGDLLSVPSVAC